MVLICSSHYFLIYTCFSYGGEASTLSTWPRFWCLFDICLALLRNLLGTCSGLLQYMFETLFPLLFLKCSLQERILLLLFQRATGASAPVASLCQVDSKALQRHLKNPLIPFYTVFGQMEALWFFFLLTKFPTSKKDGIQFIKKHKTNNHAHFNMTVHCTIRTNSISTPVLTWKIDRQVLTTHADTVWEGIWTRSNCL